MNIAAHLRDIVTIWPIIDTDGYGGYIFGAPYTLRARWQEEQVKFISGEGEESVSRATAILSRYVPALDYIALGDFTVDTDPLRTGTAMQIRASTRATNLRKSTQLNQVFM